MSVLPIDDPRLTAIGLLSEVHAGLNGRMQPALVAAGLSDIDFETLIRLSRSPGERLRMTDLAAQTGLSTSGVTRVVDRLERDGLLARVACPTDRRASYATLTEAGRDRLATVLPHHLSDIDTCFTGLLAEEELEFFLGILRRIRDVVRPCATAGAAESRPQAESLSPVRP
ncbi:MarR family winged helix-turn-helix transcriptional regulator [Nonomuraea cavernae]|uniref:MarR family transcriptional regulator n=1 Tax=Nonomuraea cavernae TaxID=2045107 RepID=A0A918DP32_9ACTN|nr:MarR family winged helix-turn-helix transcriptional regulator [Nonomuraea cavernae]MCA2189928.1 MarR family winged helix-turn-helix transcriptional regulator [Nonomuraea cavernae]GGO77910.1 MarR family transcriptional regulator [Nonomuraea cavernae]